MRWKDGSSRTDPRTYPADYREAQLEQGAHAGNGLAGGYRASASRQARRQVERGSWHPRPGRASQKPAHAPARRFRTWPAARPKPRRGRARRFRTWPDTRPKSPRGRAQPFHMAGRTAVASAALVAMRPRTASDLADGLGEFSDLFERHPLVLGGLAGARRARILVAPTETEARLVGDASARLKRRARAMAEEQFERAGRCRAGVCGGFG